MDRYHTRMVRLARAFVSSEAAAEEVAQDTWMAVLGGLSAFEGRSSLKSWVFAILVNQAKTRGVRDKRSVPFSSLDPAPSNNEPAVDPGRFNEGGMWAGPPQPWEEDTPEKLLLRGETLGVVEKAIEKLPDLQKAVLVLWDVEGVESEDICKILEISETNQRVLLHRARSSVRRALEEHLKK